MKPFFIAAFSVLFFFLFSNGCSLDRPSNQGQVSEPLQHGFSIVSSERWLEGKGLSQTESILFDEDNKVFYVSNGKAYKEGVDGFLSKVAADGQLEQLRWVDSLSRPTGMAIHNGRLYVADVNRLVVINTANGEVEQKIAAPVAQPGLNDVAIAPNGDVFVTASFIHAVYKLDNGQLALWAADEEKLAWANGITVQDGQVLVAGLRLAAIDLSSKAITEIKPNAPVEDFDGISADGKGGYFLSTVENSALWHLDKQLAATQLPFQGGYFGDLTFAPQQNKLFVARGNHEKGEYFIEVISVGKN